MERDTLSLERKKMSKELTDEEKENVNKVDDILERPSAADIFREKAVKVVAKETERLCMEEESVQTFAQYYVSVQTDDYPIYMYGPFTEHGAVEWMALFNRLVIRSLNNYVRNETTSFVVEAAKAFPEDAVKKLEERFS